jgi:tetratricopeptide (TPR) repeat protein
MPLSLEALLRLKPEQALLRVRNASRVPEAVCQGLSDHVFSLRFKDPDLMERWGRVADAAAGKTVDQLTAGLARAHFGNALRIRGDYQGAMAALNRAEELLPSAHPLIHEFRASLLMGCRDHKAAFSELRKAEDLRSARGDRIGLAKVLIQVGMVYDFLRQPGDAARMLEEAINILVGFGAEAREFLLVALLNFVDCLISAGQLGRARELLDEIEQPLAASGRNAELRLIWLRGRLESHSVADKEACGLYEAARAGYRELGMRREVALITLHLAAQHHQFCRYATCVREALKVKADLEALGLDENVQVTDLLGQLATRSGDLEQAIWTLTSVIAASRQKQTKSA